MTTPLHLADATDAPVPAETAPPTMARLVAAVQALSGARSVEAVAEIVRDAARELTGADGATFVLRDGDRCYYADENAIGPLWKGQRFPMHTCISGWVMLNAQPAVIEDIYSDSRIPADAYRPTFVKSLAMVPIRVEAPLGAIGNYWARNRRPTPQEISLLQTLANFTSVAIQNFELYASLQDKIAALQNSNEELAGFAWAASHDLRSPLRAIENLAEWIEQDIANGELDKAKEQTGMLRGRARRLDKLLASILEYAQVDRESLLRDEEIVDGSQIADDVDGLTIRREGFELEFTKGFRGVRLPRMAAQRVLVNLIGNAFKHHDRDAGSVVVDGREEGPNYVVEVTDDGPGIPDEFRETVFGMFKTLKPRDVTEGSGMGLAVVRRILAVHGGRISIEAAHGRGSTFRMVWLKRGGLTV